MILMWTGAGDYTRMGVWRVDGVTLRVLGWITPDGRFAWDPATLKRLAGPAFNEARVEKKDV